MRAAPTNAASSASLSAGLDCHQHHQQQQLVYDVVDSAASLHTVEWLGGGGSPHGWLVTRPLHAE